MRVELEVEVEDEDQVRGARQTWRCATAGTWDFNFNARLSHLVPPRLPSALLAFIAVGELLDVSRINGMGSRCVVSHIACRDATTMNPIGHVKGLAAKADLFSCSGSMGLLRTLTLPCDCTGIVRVVWLQVNAK